MLTRRAFSFTPLAAVAVAAGQDRKPNMFADAEAYERFMGRWSRLAAGQLVEFTGVPAEGRFLDAGSGTGSLAFALAERNPRAHVLGIDPSKEYVDYASSKNILGQRVGFETGDAQRLRFSDGSFDATLSLFVFNFIPDYAKALGECKRVTKPGGRIAAAVWDYGGEMQMLRAFWDSVVSVDAKAERLDERHMPLCRAGELSELWRKGGLESVREQPQTVVMKFGSFADYWDPFLLGQGPAGAYVRKLNPDQMAALRLAVKKRVSPSTESAPITLRSQLWSVCGVVPEQRR